MRSHPPRLVGNPPWVVWMSSPFCCVLPASSVSAVCCWARRPTPSPGLLRPFWASSSPRAPLPQGRAQNLRQGPSWFCRSPPHRLCAVAGQPPLTVPPHPGRLQPTILRQGPPPCTMYQAFDPFHPARNYKSLSTTGLDVYLKASPGQPIQPSNFILPVCTHTHTRTGSHSHHKENEEILKDYWSLHCQI